jgi:hypothetical protein
MNALLFEFHQETEIDRLYREILSGKYEIGRSRAFIVFEPVQREIFAADFRDRVVHHYVIGRLEPYMERLFIQDSYSCRRGKGTHFGVKRIDHFIRSCSRNYTCDCYLLKIDIQGFFMNINKELLYLKVVEVIERYYHDFDRTILIDLCRKIILHNPVENCYIKGSREDWKGLPPSKSLFSSGGKKGLPIGNLTSQIFANLYLNDFDQYVKRNLKFAYYGHYVDDCVLVDCDKRLLSASIKHLSDYLYTTLGLRIHPNKIYLQHYTKGVVFAGIYLLPYRKYAGKRIKHKMHKAMINQYLAAYVEDNEMMMANLRQWVSAVNSYFGLCKHYQTYRLRKSLVERISFRDPVGFDSAFQIANLKAE